MAYVLRPLAIVLGSTFAVHHLAERYRHRLEVAEAPDPATTISSFPGRLGDALTPDGVVVEAIGRTAVLAAAAAAAGVAIGWLWITIRHRRDRNRITTERPISGLSAGLLLAVAVPGLSWLPLSRWVVDQGLVPEGPLPALDAGLESYRSIALWSVLIGLAIAPTVAAALSGGRAWTSIGAGGHPALAPLATRPSSELRWRVGLPTLTFGLALALAEVVSSNGGLVDRFVDTLAAGRTDDLLPLATPLILGGALLAPLTDVGAAVLRRVERPRVPGSDQARPARRSTVLTIALGGLVIAAAVIGAATGPDPEATAEALRGPALGGPWLGTDAIGRSVAARSGAALAVSLAASAIPAAAATLAGAGLAAVRRTPGSTVGAVVGWLLDLLSWPAALVVPLAIWPVAADDGSPLDRTAALVTALLLVPAATRMLARALGARSLRLARLGATLCLLAAASLAIQLFARFVAPADGSRWPTLGGLTATGLATDEVSPWPVLGPLLAAVAAGTALYWVADTLTRVGHARAQSAADEPPSWLSGADQERGVLARRRGPGETGLSPVADEPAAPRVTLADDATPVPAPVEPAITLAAPISDEDDAVDIRDDISIALAVDVPALADATSIDEKTSVDEKTSIDDEASQTIELRPSDLRRAGLHPDQP